MALNISSSCRRASSFDSESLSFNCFDPEATRSYTPLACSIVGFNSVCLFLCVCVFACCLVCMCFLWASCLGLGSPWYSSRCSCVQHEIIACCDYTNWKSVLNVLCRFWCMARTAFVSMVQDSYGHAQLDGPWPLFASPAWHAHIYAPNGLALRFASPLVSFLLFSSLRFASLLFSSLRFSSLLFASFRFASLLLFSLVVSSLLLSSVLFSYICISSQIVFSLLL
jgi:hypothetical protein